jgi:hypothetical protein
MKRISFSNLSSNPVRLQVEPWAREYDVAPEDQVEIHYDDTEYDIEFSICEDGSPFISIYSKAVRIMFGNEVTEYNDIGFERERGEEKGSE